MKEILEYQDEISGKVFGTQEEAVASEKKHGGIKKLFSFWIEAPKDDSCSFSNGSWCYQRTEAEVNRYKEALVSAVKIFEVWIASQYEDDGGIAVEHMGSGYMIGRYLCDGNSPLYSKYCTLSNICPNCYREWGQPYYASNCSCNKEPKEI